MLSPLIALVALYVTCDSLCAWHDATRYGRAVCARWP